MQVRTRIVSDRIGTRISRSERSFDFFRELLVPKTQRDCNILCIFPQIVECALGLRHRRFAATCFCDRIRVANLLHFQVAIRSFHDEADEGLSYALTLHQAQGGASAGLEAPTIGGKRFRQRSTTREVCRAHCLCQASTCARYPQWASPLSSAPLERNPSGACTHFTLLAAKMMYTGRG